MSVKLFALLLLVPCCSTAQNLITNSGAEVATPGSGWVVASIPDNSCTALSASWRVQGSAISTTPHSGSYIFYPGCNNAGTGGTYELYQDVNVTANAAAIDAGTSVYTFAGWYSGYNQATPDQCRFIEEYRDAANGLISSFNSGAITTATNTSNTQAPWARLVNTATVPAGTRTIRIRLQAIHRTGTAIDAYFDDLSLVTGSIPLPLSLNGLTGNAIAGGIALDWKDDNAQGHTGYDIYWSRNGAEWQQIGQRQVYEVNAGSGSYSFLHSTPVTGSNYYRIGCRSKNGDVDYSQVVNTLLTGSKTVDFVTSPNPAVNELMLTLSATTTAVATIHNMQGQPVRQLQLTNGLNKVDVSSIPAGSYTLSLVTDAGVVTKLLVINR